MLEFGSLKLPGRPLARVRHPRVWAIVLVVAALPVGLVGYNLTFLCYVHSATGCYAAYDPSQGIPMLVVAGMLVLGAAMLLTAGRTPHPRARDGP